MKKAFIVSLLIAMLSCDKKKQTESVYGESTNASQNDGNSVTNGSLSENSAISTEVEYCYVLFKATNKENGARMINTSDIFELPKNEAQNVDIQYKKMDQILSELAPDVTKIRIESREFRSFPTYRNASRNRENAKAEITGALQVVEMDSI